MKTLTKCLSAGVVVISLSGVVFAADMTINQASAPNPNMMPLCMPHVKQCDLQKNKNNFTGSWVTALHQTRQLTAAQAKTVAEAALILYGDSSMQVGSITPISGNNGHQNYQVQITNINGSVLTTLIMNGSNGKIIPPMQGLVSPVLNKTTL